MPSTASHSHRARVPYSRELLYLTLIEKQGAEKRANGQFLILLLPTTINEDSERGRMITTTKQEGISP